jgi:regulator of ribosome biosynthesis
MERPDESIVAVLPPPTTILPREKPIPKPKPLTKWELFAKRKGIKKTKRSQMVYDEISRKYKPRWGYKRVNDPKDDWLIEVPENADNNEDQFAKRDQERKERIAKNEYQRLRNVAGNQKRKLKIKGNWLIA